MRFLNRRQIFAAIAVASALAGCAQAQPKAPQGGPGDVTITSKTGPHRFHVDVVADEPSREKGLMFVKSMAPDHGMLFEFEQEADQAFWMRNTYISLDIIYIDAKGKIVSIQRDAKPFDETPLPSNGPAIGVLEINGGMSAKLGIAPGDKVTHPFFKN